MPRFPTREADIKALAWAMFIGFTAHPADFPNAKVMELVISFSEYKGAKDAQNRALAAEKKADAAKKAGLNSLKEIMKNLLSKSEVDAAGAPQKLEYIGWGPKAAPMPVEAPAPPLNLHTVAEGRGTVRLAWESPEADSGGPVRNYIIERRHQSEGGEFGSWTIAGTALTNEINLTAQPCRLPLEYLVRAINTGGESPPSNTISVVL
jgi:hypothetical protein